MIKRITKGPLPHLYSVTWRVTYRCARPQPEDMCFQIDHEIHAPSLEECSMLLSNHMRQYGGIRYDQIGEINEITN